MSRLPRYRLPPALRKHVLTTGLSAPPLTLCLDFQVNSTDGREPELEPEDVEDTESPCGNTPDDAESPATSTSKGSFNWDREKGEFNIEWANLAAFETWRREEEQMYSIEFAASTTQPRTSLYTRHQLFVCGREASRGEVSYEKKNPDSERKIGTKKTGCGCHIWIKLYPHTSTILGCYVAEHDHEIGFANITYTRLSGSARERIKAMLTQKVEHHEIVSCRAGPKKV